MAIESLGIGSGLLTSELADNIINAERVPTESRLDVQKEIVEAKISAFGEIKSALDSFQSAAAALSTSKNIEKTSVSSTDEDAITATTNSLAAPGTYSLEVSQLAQNHSLVTQRFDTLQDTLGTGTITFKFGETTFGVGDSYDSFDEDVDIKGGSINVASGSNTISDIRDAINKEDFGVDAQIVNDGEGYRLLLTSSESGKSHSMEITVSGSSSLKALSYNSAENDPASNMTQTQIAQDAAFKVNGLDITSSTNKPAEVVKGATFQLKQTNVGQPVTISISQDTDEVVENMETFISSYNEFQTLYKDYTKYNPDAKTGGLLLGESSLRTVQAQMRRILTGTVTGMDGMKYQSMVELGIETDQNNNFAMTLNVAKFTEALEEQAEQVAGVLAVRGNTDDSFIEYVNASIHTQPGTYDIEILQAATQATINTSTVGSFDFLQDVLIDDNNDNLTLTIDGKKATVDFVHGAYSSGEDLAEMMKSAINNNDTFSKYGKSVTINFDDVNDRMEIISSKYGSDSELAINSTDVNSGSTLGLVALSDGPAQGDYFTNLGVKGFGATTVEATQELGENTGIDFSTVGASFQLQVLGTGDGAVDGIDFPITLDQDVGDVYDLNGNVTTDRGRDDVLGAIQDKIDATALNGYVTASFNINNRLVFSTTPQAGTQTININAVGSTSSDVLLGLSATDGPQTSGVAIPANTEFQLDYGNQTGDTTTGVITIPNATYETSADLQTAIQTAINTHADVIASESEAFTFPGSVDLSPAITFETDQAGFEFEYNGTAYDVDVDTTVVDNLGSIQAAIDTAIGGLPNQVVASLSGNGLVLTTENKGSTETLNVTKNGDGARTNVAGVTPLAATDFSSNISTFDLTVDGETIGVTVNGNGSGSIDDSLVQIQNGLNDALEAVNGGGTFQANDVIAKLDDGGFLYFETQSKMGVATEETFGAAATIAVSNTNANAQGILDLTDVAGQNGFDSLGLPQGLFSGFDATATVTYDVNDDDQGSFSVAFDDDTSLEFLNVSEDASTFLGFSDPSGEAAESATGLDVEGTINGVTANGSGQYLTAGDGTEAATSGYIVGGIVAGFGTAVTTTASGDTFKLLLNGVESDEISMPNKTYTNGEDFASDLQSLINADTNFSSKEYQVSVDYDDDLKRFGIQFDLTGEQSTISFSEISASLSVAMGMTTSTPSVGGIDQSGSRDAASGLQLRITGGLTGERGTVSYIKGAADQLKTLVKSFLDDGGLIDNKLDALDSELVDIEVERTEMTERLDAQLARLKAQFLYNDKIISSLKTTENFLTQQFEAMNASNDK